MEIYDDFQFEQETESDYLFQASSRPNPVQEAKLRYDIGVMSALEIASEIDPYAGNLEVGVEVPALDAVGWVSGHRNVDIRPRLVDLGSGEARLVDSGAQISATARKPGDKIDESVNLIAVNGSKIKTYGLREIQFKINRKAYSIMAVVCDIPQDILGMDFITKYKLNFEWDDSDLYIVDKKAQIRSRLKIVTVPTSLTRAHHVEPVSVDPKVLPGAEQVARRQSNQSTFFEVSCIKKLETEKPVKLTTEQALSQHSPEYRKMIETYPELLEPTFKKGKPAHGVYHRIETGDQPPAKSKRRPIIADSEKAKKGKEIWDQMLKDGIIEKVEPGSNTDWSSALHLADKPGGGVRPCTDFRLVNQRTITDAHPLPLLRDFTSQLHGAKVFSIVDLRSAFFNIPIWPPHKHKTLTLSPWGGSFVYNRLPFGLSSGPSSWQKVLEWVLRDIKNVFIYLDDVLVFGESKETHDETLKKVFKRLAENNMALSLEKCSFGKDSVKVIK